MSEDTWSPTWYAFEVTEPGVDFHSVPATLVVRKNASRWNCSSRIPANATRLGGG